MKKDVAEKLVIALRSGKYNQTPGKLGQASETGAAFCCLGVLCEVAIENGVKVQKNQREYGGLSYDGNSSFPPEAVAEWAGVELDLDYTDSDAAGNSWSVTDSDPDTDSETVTLSELNDDRGYSFSQIADAIEKEFINA